MLSGGGCEVDVPCGGARGSREGSGGRGSFFRPVGTAADPLGQELDFFRGEFALRRHLCVIARVTDDLDEPTGVRLSGDDDSRHVARSQDAVTAIKSQIALLLVWSVTGEAALREQRSDAALEVNLALIGNRGERREHDRCCDTETVGQCGDRS